MIILSLCVEECSDVERKLNIAAPENFGKTPS